MWCHDGTMKRMNLRDVPDEVYADLAAAAEDSRQSLNAYVVERLVEAARTSRTAEYVRSYPAPSGSTITRDDVLDALHEGRRSA